MRAKCHEFLWLLDNDDPQTQDLQNMVVFSAPVLGSVATKNSHIKEIPSSCEDQFPFIHCLSFFDFHASHNRRNRLPRHATWLWHFDFGTWILNHFSRDFDKKVKFFDFSQRLVLQNVKYDFIFSRLNLPSCRQRCLLMTPFANCPFETSKPPANCYIVPVVGQLMDN